MITFYATQKRTQNNFTTEENMTMIQEYLTTNISMNRMTKKYHIGHNTIPKWMSIFGIPMPNDVLPQSTMVKKKDPNDTAATVESLEAQLKALQAELEREKLKNLVLDTMIDVAEKELHIDIRKKAGAKQ